MNGSSVTANPRSTYQAIPQWSERVWVMLVGILLLNSVLRGIRPPNRWALTHFLSNYDFGFAKRSLQGAVFAALDIPAMYTYSFAFWYMMSVLAANVLILLWLMRRLCAVGDLTSRLIALVFASSLAVVVLAHIVGYGDQVGLLVTLLAVLLRDFYKRCIFVAVVFPICVLIQETQFVMFFPLLVFRFLIDLGDKATEQRRKLLSLCLVCACVFATLLIVLSTRLSEASATEMYQSIQPSVEFPLTEYGITLTTTLTDNFRMTMDFYKKPSGYSFILFSWVVTLPITAYLMRTSWSQMIRDRQSMFLRLVAMGASAAPLAMHVIAVDANRFASFALITSFLVYATVRLRGGVDEQLPSVPKANVLLPAALIAMSLSSSIPLFEGYVVRSFPYEELLFDLSKVAALREPFPPHPELCFGTGDVCLFVHDGMPHSGISKADFCANEQ
ncbi:hypothetical protein JM946_29455 [Steroidobacter sp. S1-65]|uniref:Uncharacterized protein n=1 Tax=Steroidobacter gossypii TaxID=2805490 RepID=A0ABS1X6N1_9GAMM|nr:hypothetical protein [Steroidobacter gossypii]MBM0108878.1 hypothetical protein [Steroidobacter gossypii]